MSNNYNVKHNVALIYKYSCPYEYGLVQIQIQYRTASLDVTTRTYQKLCSLEEDIIK